MDGLSNANELIASIKKIPNPSTMTLDDWDNVKQAVQIVSGHGRSVATKVKKSAMVKDKVDTTEPQYEIKTTNGWTSVSDDTYNKLRKVRSVDARNKLSEKLLGTGVKLEHKDYNPFNTSQHFGIFRYTPGQSKIEVKGKRNHWWGDENLVEGVENLNFKKINFTNPYTKYYSARTQPNVPDNKPLQQPDVEPQVKPAETAKPTETVKPVENKKKNNKPKRARKHELGGYFKFLRTGGAVKYQEGGKTGIGAGEGYNWYNNVFSGYRQHILDGLSTKGYVNWLNTMQGSHAGIYNAAGGKNGSWRGKAYENESVKNYQTQYQTGFNGYDTGNPYNTNGIGKAYNTPKHYDFSGSNKRGTLEVNKRQFRGSPDGLYSQMTDDRRLLGREGDWPPEQLAKWQTALQAKGFKMELDPNDKYYRILPIDNSKQNVDPNNEGDQKPQAIKPQDTETERLQKQLPKAELKKPLDPRALLIGARAATNILSNDWMFDRMLDRQPLWYSKDFIDRKLDTIGDYAAIANAGNQSADLRTIQRLRQVSDQSLNLAADFESGRIGREIDDKARLLDANKQAVTHEAAVQLDMKDLEDARDTAFINRKLMYDYLSDRFDMQNAKDKARVDATVGAVDNLTNLYAGKYLEKKAVYNEATKNMMQTPREYAIEQMQTLYPELHNAVSTGNYKPEQLAKYQELMAGYLKDGREKYYQQYYSLYGGRIKTPDKLHGIKDKDLAVSKKGGKLEFIKSLRR